MDILCDIGQKTHCICAQRSYKEHQISCGAMFYGYGTVPRLDAIMDNGVDRAVKAVAGFVTKAIEEASNDPAQCTDIQAVAHQLATALRTASRTLWEISRLAGQGLYVGGTIVYTYKQAYIATAFGGAELLSFSNGYLCTIAGQSDDKLIYDAVGGKNGWAGKFVRGDFSSHDILFGTTGPIIHKHEDCTQQLQEYTMPGIHTTTGAMIVRQYLDIDPECAAVIEYRKQQEGT